MCLYKEFFIGSINLLSEDKLVGRIIYSEIRKNSSRGGISIKFG